MNDLTICIPTYNRAEYLREAIKSVLNQTHAEFALLVSDNASTDQTFEVVQSFGDPRIRYHRNSINVGIGQNHRMCVELTKTRLISFLSDDDLFTPDHIARSLSAFERHPQAAYVACALDLFGAGTSGVRHPAALQPPLAASTFFSAKQAVSFLGLENPGFLNTIVAKRDAFCDDFFWGSTDFVHMDVLIMTQLMAQGGFVYLSDPSVKYRCHTTNISQQLTRVRYTLKLASMIAFATRYLAQYLLDKGIATQVDLIDHGMTVSQLSCVRNLVFAFSAFEASSALRVTAKAIFQARRDIDSVPSKFSLPLRMARLVGMWPIPVFERASRSIVHWTP